MQSRLTVIATLVFLAGIAIFVWYLSSSTREQAVPGTAVAPKPREKQPPPTINAPLPKPKPPLPATTRTGEAEPPLEAPAPESPSITGARVEGLVITETGRPVKDAKVFVGPETAEPRAQTDEKGRFVIDGLSTTDTLLTVTREKYVTGAVSISPEVGKTGEVRITLVEGGAIEGVVSRGGAPAPGEIVQTSQKTTVTPESLEPPEQDTTVAHQATTDAQGHYVLENLAFGGIQLEVVEGEFKKDRDVPGWARAVAIVVSGQTTVVNFDLPSTQSVIQGVVLVEGQPPEAAVIQANIVSDYGPLNVGVHAQPDGTYRLERLPAGTVTLVANAYTPEGKLKRSVDLTLGESQVVQNDFLFSGVCFVSGTVTGVLAGEYAEVAAMTEFPSDASALTFEDLLNMGDNIVTSKPVSPDATFRLDALEPGRYMIVAVAVASELGAQQGMPQIRTTHKQVELRAGMEVQINLAFH